MECNRGEAIRARDIALEKFSKHDFFGAKKFMVKAQQLFPTLEGLPQLLAIVEVHLVSQVKVGIGGLEMDWYGILQVPPGSDENTVKKQYRRLALLLHPDKNKAAGAEAAFKLIGEAWGILSDNTKRLLHDMKRSGKVTANVRVAAEQQKRTQANKAPPQNPASAPAPAQAHPAPSGRGAKFANRAQRADASNFQYQSTFWTVCPSCQVQYQYHRYHLNIQIKCQNCQKVFLAREMDQPPAGHNNGTIPNQFNFGRGRGRGSVPPAAPTPPPGAKPADAAPGANGFANGGYGDFPSYPPQNSSFFSPAAAEAVAQSKVAAAAAAAAAATTSSPANNPSANVVHQTFYRVKRDRVQNKRKDKEEQLKSQDPSRHQEAMDRLRAKRDERSVRDSVKRKVEVKRRLKRKKRASDDEEDVSEADLDSTSEIRTGDPSLFDDISSPSMPRRRSSRAKKNVAYYKVDPSDDDSDMENFEKPNAKRAKADAEGSSDPENQKSNGRDSSRRTSVENGEKGKGSADGPNSGKRATGERDELERSRTPGRQGIATFGDVDGQKSGKGKETSASKQGTADGRNLGAFGRDQSWQELEGQRMRRGKFRQDVEQQAGVTVKKEDVPQREVGGMQDARLETKAPKTQRVRVNSPKVPLTPGQAVDDDRRGNAGAAAPAQESSSGDAETDAEDDEQNGNESIDVPDPDFNDFDRFRTEKDIRIGQIWAIYDDEDGMPRFYGRIDRVYSRPSFKVILTWLEYVPATQRSKQMMDATGLSIGAGNFRLAKETEIGQINTFSHLVNENPSPGDLKIYPKKDQVWAVFRDWNSEKFEPKKLRKSRGGSNAYNYDMVLVLSDYDQARGGGIRTVKLGKVAGYKTLFHRLSGDGALQVYTDVERFSHSVPNAVLEEKTVQENGVPRGSLELDPAATPMDLITQAPGPRAQ